ncbi:tyrosine-type recombinase/integrase [Roseateles sp.]|uniref:tyrosine-type recombinase/integrase n=1 Tax=Roseateles sp. TaxID=1971397 RepID=UPI003D11B6A7
MSETKGKGADRITTTEEFDLRSLSPHYSTSFLIELKNLLIDRRKRVALITVKTEFTNLRSLFRQIHENKIAVTPITQIDQPLLLGLRTILEEVSAPALNRLKGWFNDHHESLCFADDLTKQDFPTKKSAKGAMGELTARILTRALTRAACVTVLRAADEAYEEGVIEIGTYSCLHLAFHIFCRPTSYRRLRLADLRIDRNPETETTNYFLLVSPAKTQVSNPGKFPFQLNKIVGELLEAQRLNVIDNFSHLVDQADIGKLAMFPSVRLNKDRDGWVSEHAQRNFGQCTNNAFITAYFRSLYRLIPSVKFNFNALRHTIGTQLAEAGCSGKTIQAVLKHASDKTCQAYVDIAFHGLIDQLSDTLQPGFEEHFPTFDKFRSKTEPVDPQRAIRSDDLATNRSELTGECGRSIACQFAPLSCYACPRFIPCFDADHTINLDLVDTEIVRCKQMGLPFRHMLSRATDIRRHIIVVMAASDRKRHEMAAGATA